MVIVTRGGSAVVTHASNAVWIHLVWDWAQVSSCFFLSHFEEKGSKQVKSVRISQIEKISSLVGI